MIKPDKPRDEAGRIEVLHQLGLLDTPQEERYDRLIRKLAQLLDVPIAYVALIDSDRQWMKCRIGDVRREMSRDESFCGHTILAHKPLIVPDTLLDERFAENPMVVGGPKLRFYAGIPLTSGGHNIGTLCIADSKPRELSREDLEIIKAFASLILQNIEMKPKVFISYCHRDEEWKERLVGHLRVLEEQGLLTLWDDRQIDAGETWRGEIQDAMESSDVAILLISANFLTSRFILDEEVPRLLQRRDTEGLTIVPLVIKPCSWERVGWLESMNLFPKDGKPLSGAADHDIDGDLATLASIVLDQASRRNPELATAVGEAPHRPSPAPAGDMLPPNTIGPLGHLRDRIEESGEFALAPDALTQVEQTVSHEQQAGPPIKMTVRDLAAASAPSESFVFRKERLSVGRAPSNDLPLPDPQRIISSEHAQLDVEERRILVTDLGSKNFTLLNGSRLEPNQETDFNPGDVVTIGDYEIQWAPIEEAESKAPHHATVFAPSYVNPFTDDARLLADVLRRVGELYDREASTRRDDALTEALSEALGGDAPHEVLAAIARVLARD